jgi:hypothetical protein
MKKVRLFILMFVAGVFVTTSCEFGDINVDPTALANASLKDQLPSAIGQTVFNVGASGARGNGLFMQHFFGVEAQQQQMMNYVIDDNTFNNFWAFGLYGAGAMKDCQILITEGTAQEQPHYVGIGKVLMAVNLGMATQCWGDVPYSAAFLGQEGEDNFKPTFDTQESIYGSIQQLLTEGITELSKPAVSGGPGSDDLIYGGDTQGWIQTAHGLKARYYMHLIKRDSGAPGKALAELAQSYASNADESMFFEFGGLGANDANPYGQFGAQRPNTLAIMPTFSDHMAGKSDPRQPYFMSGSSYYTGPAGLFWSSYTSPLPILSYTEVKFLEAEAEIRSGNNANAGAALTEAITANMDQIGIDPADYAAYVATYGATSGITLERIITEKWTALYAQNEFEIWTDYRRTGFPALTPNPAGVNGSNPSGVIPRRWIYPIDERSSNTENMDAAIASQGGEKLDVALWAFK